MDKQTLITICIAGSVSTLAYVLLRMLMNRAEGGKLRSRLEDGSAEQHARQTVETVSVKEMLHRFGSAFARPFMPKKRETQSSLRRNLSCAGIYTPGAIKFMTGCKVIFLVVGLTLGYVAGMVSDQLMLGLSLGGLIGYLAPQMWLRLKIKQNQKALTNGLPDALDLMVVCVEAGLTVDSAMQRVGQELALAHPRLSRELGIAHMETRVGLSRAESLRNLGQRTGCASLQSLAAMLVQADRFGTSIATALRIHAESLRTTRQHAAEEMAAKASVKMSFPLVLFIFPATFIVLAGPTVLGLMNSALFQ